MAVRRPVHLPRLLWLSWTTKGRERGSGPAYGRSMPASKHVRQEGKAPVARSCAYITSYVIFLIYAVCCKPLLCCIAVVYAVSLSHPSSQGCHPNVSAPT